MFQKEIAFYLGEERESGFTGYLIENNLFLILEIEEGFSNEDGREFLKLIKERLVDESINNLAGFDSFINRVVQEANLPANFSAAAGFLKDKIVYLKTVGSGKIYLRRKKDFAKILEGDQIASGHGQLFDIFVFTTENFVEKVGGEEKMKKIFDNRKPHEIVEEITPNLKNSGDLGLVALFLQLKAEAEVEEEVLEEEKTLTFSEKPWKKFIFKIKSIYQHFYPREIIGRKKTLTLLMVLTIGLILVWSVGLGYQRRKQAKIKKTIETTKKLVIQKLTQAEEVAFLNLPRAQVLISESKQEIERLKKELGVKNYELGGKELEKLVQETENKIIKKEEKNYQEFYDLALDSKEAKGDKLYLDKNNLAILDKKIGRIYLLSLDKKSLIKRSEEKIKQAELIASYNNEIFFFLKNDGIYKINNEGKLKKVIEHDEDWGEIIDMWIYNGNIYLLDRQKDEIYKYLVAKDGYSGKNSYFKTGQAVSLKDANSMAIDASIYVGFTSHIKKYTAGIRDQFKTDFPDKTVNLNKIFTSKDLEKVYGWDKNKGVVYILGKNGTYERQIKSSIFVKGEDIVIYDNKIFVLLESKIYIIE